MSNQKRLVALTQKLLSIDSQNPPGNEVAIADFIVGELKTLGLEVRTFTYQDNRPNVVATLKGSWPRARARREALLLTPHTDVVPIGKGWRYDAYGRDIVGKRIYGRGASDDKGNLACAMEALRSLLEEGFRPRKDIILAATADEETGSHAGIKPLLVKKILRPRLALVLDSVDFDTVIAQKGLMHLRVIVQGKKAHGATNWKGVNAIEQSAEIIRRLKAIRWDFSAHPLLNHPTVNIGTIHGGDKVNIVADHCEFSVDLRFMPGMKSKEIFRSVRREVAAVTSRARLVVDDLQEPFEMPSDNQFVQLFQAAAVSVGKSARLKGSDGATVISFFKKQGIPAFATGFGKSGTQHINDEYAEIPVLYQGARVLERFVRAYDAI